MKLIRADYIFIFAIIFFAGAHATTMFMLKHYEDQAKMIGVAQSVVYEAEANPIARYMLELENFKYIYSFALVPGMLTGIYWFIRNKRGYDELTIEAYAVAFCSIAFLNVMNDVSLMLGIWL